MKESVDKLTVVKVLLDKMSVDKMTFFILAKNLKNIMRENELFKRNRENFKNTVH